ncbi:MAG: undecaprenyl-phosphate glucose phosphotransferase [Hyphomicrobiaceae bacterium]
MATSATDDINPIDILSAGDKSGSTDQNRKLASRRIAADMVGFMDVIAVVTGGMIPAFIYVYGGGLDLDWLKHTQMCLVSAAIVYGCLRHFNMYDESRMHDFPVSPRHLILSLFVAFSAVLGLGIPFAPKVMHLWIWYSAWIATSFMLLLDVRLAARHILAKMTKAGHFNARVAVFGNGAVARRVEEHLRNPALGIRFAGLFDDRVDANRIDSAGPKLTGKLQDLMAAARSGTIDRIVIALPQAAEQRIIQVARSLEHLPVSLHVVTHIASDLVETGPAHNVSAIGSVGLIDIKDKPLADWNRVVKNCEDYVLGTLLLILTLPVMAIIAAAIKLTSPGPVFFRQKRRGLNHRPFDVFKFRTMNVVEPGDNFTQAKPEDPRVTGVGRFLRKHSLDELPQLFNVLRGEMSLVGPRPHAVKQDDEFGETVERYANRQQVKPGMTGLAQVSGFRGCTENPELIQKRLELDIEYVATWSLWEDVKILTRTVSSVLTGKNAY